MCESSLAEEMVETKTLVIILTAAIFILILLAIIIYCCQKCHAPSSKIKPIEPNFIVVT